MATADEIYAKVRETLVEALGLDDDEVTPEATLIGDLGAESIDFLDMVFRLERAFKIKIPRGKIVENARGTLTEAEFEQKGIVTDVGMAQLRAYIEGMDPVNKRPFVQEVIEGLTAPLNEADLTGVSFERTTPRLLEAGTEADLLKRFEEERWTDYLPIVLPTEERVAAVLGRDLASGGLGAAARATQRRQAAISHRHTARGRRDLADRLEDRRSAADDSADAVRADQCGDQGRSVDRRAALD